MLQQIIHKIIINDFMNWYKQLEKNKRIVELYEPNGIQIKLRISMEV